MANQNIKIKLVPGEEEIPLVNNTFDTDLSGWTIHGDVTWENGGYANCAAETGSANHIIQYLPYALPKYTKIYYEVQYKSSSPNLNNIGILLFRHGIFGSGLEFINETGYFTGYHQDANVINNIVIGSSYTGGSPAQLSISSIRLWKLNQASYLDLYNDTEINLNFKCNDVSDVLDKSGGYSLTFDIPGSAKNNTAFGFLNDINSSNVTKLNKPYTTEVFVDDIKTFDGTLTINSVSIINGETRYNVTLNETVGDLAASCGDLVINGNDDLLNDIAFDQYNHILNVTNITSSFYNTGSGDGYFYPLIDRGYTNNVVYVDRWKPAIYNKTILDNIFAKHDFVYSSSFLNSDTFKSTAYYREMPINLADVDLAYNYVFTGTSLVTTMTTSSAIDPSDFTIDSEVIFFPNTVSDPDNAWFLNYWKCLHQGNYKATVKLKYKLYWENNSANDIYLNEFYVGPSNGQSYPQSGSNLPFPFFEYFFWLQKNNINYYTTPRLSDDNDLQRNVLRGNIPTDGVYLDPQFNPIAAQQFPRYYLPTSTTYTSSIIDETLIYDNISCAYGDQLEFAAGIDLHNLIGYEDFDPLLWGNRLRYNAGLIILSGSTIEFTRNDGTIGEGDTVQIGRYLEGIKQIDYTKNIFDTFNLYIQPDRTTPNTFIIEPYNIFYTSDVLDWSNKLDTTQEIRYEKPTYNTLNLSYKNDEDYINKIYQDKYNKTFGRYLSTNNDYETTEIKNNSIFAACPIGPFIDSSQSDMYVPKIFKVDQNGNPDFSTNIKFEPKFGFTGKLNHSLGYFDIRTTDNNTSYLISTFYPYFGYLDNPIAPTASLNFGLEEHIYHPTLDGTMTPNNLFNTYYRQMYNELISDDARYMTCYVRLSALDIAQLDFRKAYWINNTYWRLNTVENYNAKSTTKCTFFKASYISLPPLTNIPITEILPPSMASGSI